MNDSAGRQNASDGVELDMPPGIPLTSVSHLFRRLLSAVTAVLPALAYATWQDDIGYTQLAAELGAGLPKGNGVSATHVEASLSMNGEYLPTDVTQPTSGNFAGKSFVFDSGVAGISDHATRVASFFYGLNTDAALGDASEAPEVGLAPGSQIDVFEAGDWSASGFLKPGISVPQTESNAISNHSWISSDGPAATLNDLLRRLDFSVERDDYLCVAGLNNGSGSAMPYLLASAYNVIAVGLSDGEHSSGATPADLDGPGRVKPELVVPQNRTSWATAVVSSCGALLYSKADQTSGLANATKAEVLKALLLAGATKTKFPGWVNSATQPLDSHFGAGELNVRRSHQLLAAGEFNASTTQKVPPTGWDYTTTLAVGAQKNYTFTIPSGCRAAEMSVVLAWNRKIAGATGSLLVNPTPQLPALDLFLYHSTGFTVGALVASSESGANGSAAHNVEHIHLNDVPSGDYTIRVTNAASGSFSSDYALALLTVFAPASDPLIEASLPADGSTLTLAGLQLCPGQRYELQSSSNLVTWSVVQPFTATASTANFPVPASTARLFFRLRWIAPSVASPE
jgi:hypothetical protein